jgi:hypothetical protein
MIPGIQTVHVSLNVGLRVLDLKEGNTVTLARLRDVLKGGGFADDRLGYVRRRYFSIRRRVAGLPVRTGFHKSPTDANRSGRISIVKSRRSKPSSQGGLLAKPARWCLDRRQERLRRGVLHLRSVRDGDHGWRKFPFW